jgi:hypothetical protein
VCGYLRRATRHGPRGTNSTADQRRWMQISAVWTRIYVDSGRIVARASRSTGILPVSTTGANARGSEGDLTQGRRGFWEDHFNFPVLSCHSLRHRVPA